MRQRDKQKQKRVRLLSALLLAVLFAVRTSSVYAQDIFESIEEVPTDAVTVQKEAAQEALPERSLPILEGVTIDGMDVSGMTKEEAAAAVNSRLAAWKAKNLTLLGEDDAAKTFSFSELGLTGETAKALQEALSYGRSGNPVKRYKERVDALTMPRAIRTGLHFEDEVLREVLSTKCKDLTREAVDFKLTRTGGQFAVSQGQTGFAIDVDASVRALQSFLENGVPEEDATLSLVIVEETPKGSEAELSKVRDVLGSFTTNFKTSGQARSANVANGCRLAQGETVYPGEEYSVLDHIQPFTEANGYYLAGSYLNGQVVDSLGGGICQVSTTLYNAVLKSELDVTERHNHSMIVTYVEPSMDAAIAESSGKDFKFVNNTNHPIYIEGYTEGKNITFTIYGVEERESTHKVRYESETLSTTPAGPEVIHADGAQPIGFIDVQSAHVGYKARLWRVTTENGTETERVVINESNYKMVPRTATVGTATDNPANLYLINQAIASGSIDQCKATAAALHQSQAATDPAALAAATLEAALASGDEGSILAAQELVNQVAAAQETAGGADVPIDIPD